MVEDIMGMQMAQLQTNYSYGLMTVSYTHLTLPTILLV